MSVTDSNPPSSELEHRIIIWHVAESDDLLGADLSLFAQSSKTESLVDARRHELNKRKSSMHGIGAAF